VDGGTARGHKLGRVHRADERSSFTVGRDVCVPFRRREITERFLPPIRHMHCHFELTTLQRSSGKDNCALFFRHEGSEQSLATLLLKCLAMFHPNSVRTVNLISLSSRMMRTVGDARSLLDCCSGRKSHIYMQLGSGERATAWEEWNPLHRIFVKKEGF
jgi:hypothetical protein